MHGIDPADPYEWAEWLQSEDPRAVAMVRAAHAALAHAGFRYAGSQDDIDQFEGPPPKLAPLDLFWTYGIQAVVEAETEEELRRARRAMEDPEYAAEVLRRRGARQA